MVMTVVKSSSFNRSSLVKLSIGVGEAILKAHQDILKDMNKNKVFQRRIFQFIFDLKFILKLLAGGTDKKDQVKPFFFYYLLMINLIL